MEDRSRANEADAGNNLRRDAGVIAEVLDGQRVRENRIQRRAKTNKHVGAQSGRAVVQFALQSDDPAENSGKDEPKQRTAEEPARHLGMHQAADMLPVHKFSGGRKLPQVGWILHRIARVTANYALTRLITAGDTGWRAVVR